MSRRSGFVFACCLVGFASCVHTYAVWPDESASLARPTFHLAKHRGGTETVGLYAISVKRCFGQKYARLADAAWAITDESATNSVPLLSYGITPRGFHVLKSPSELRPGECYVINADGPGYAGSTEFRVTQSGTLAELTPAERRARSDSAYSREVAFGETAVQRCRRLFASAHSALDTARADSVVVRDTTKEFPPLDCGFLRSRAGGGL